LVLFFFGYRLLIGALSVRRYALRQRGNAPASPQPNIAIVDTAAAIEIDAAGVVKSQWPPTSPLSFANTGVANAEHRDVTKQ